MECSAAAKVGYGMAKTIAIELRLSGPTERPFALQVHGEWKRAIFDFDMLCAQLPDSVTSNFVFTTDIIAWKSWTGVYDGLLSKMSIPLEVGG
jgi:hypothetical protein